MMLSRNSGGLHRADEVICCHFDDRVESKERIMQRGIACSGRLFVLLISLSALACSPAHPTVRTGDPPEVPEMVSEIPVRGKLHFASEKTINIEPFQGDNTRKHIFCGPNSPQRAVWTFDKLPQGLMTPPGDVVQIKFTCEFFKLTKAAGSGGVQVVFRAVSHTCPQAPPGLQGDWQWADTKVDARGKTTRDRYLDDVASFQAKSIHLDAAKPNTDAWKAANELAEQYGYYEVRVPGVPDNTETSINLPAGLFRNAIKKEPEVGADRKPVRPLVSIYVKCETPGLFLGMAEQDLYLIEKVVTKP
jgi:hypothetical protein